MNKKDKKKDEKLKCPHCNKTNIATIFYGYPGNMKALEKPLEKGEIVLGGCIITGNDPEWSCNECGHRWGNYKEDD